MKYPIQIKTALLPGLIASALVLSACGGSGSGSSDDDAALLDSTSSRGLITGFGSVYVNGVKYETDDAEFDVDDDSSATQAALSVGQFVTVTGSIDDNGKTGQASLISYENELQGPIKNKTPDSADPSIGTMDVLGRQIQINLNTRFDDGLTFVDFNNGDFAEISGFTTADGITATYIELQNDTEVETVGEIAMLDVVPGTFEIFGFTVAYDGNTELEDNITLADGLYVEVKGELDPLDDTRLIAGKIEAEDDGKGEDEDEEELQGIVSNYNPDTNTFNLGAVKVDASTAELKPASLDLGSVPAPEVEVEGHWLDGVLIAEEVEQKGRKIKIDATLSAVGTETVTFTFNDIDVVVRVNQQTELEDDISDTDLLIGGLSTGDYVEMEAFSDGSGDINAVELKRDNPGKIRIQAPVEAFDKATKMVTLLGISFDLTNTISYEDDDDNLLSFDQFYDALSEGVFIKLKDDDSNGEFEKAELED